MGRPITVVGQTCAKNQENTDCGNCSTSEVCNRAHLQAQHGDVTGAIDTLLNHGIKLTPTSPTPYIELSKILIAAGRFDDALQVLPEMPPATDRAVILEIEAVCQAALGADEVALQAANQITDRPRGLVVLGNLSARQGDFIEAEAFFRRAVALDYSCSSGWLSLGMLLWSQGDQKEAWKALMNSVAVDPLNAEAVNILRDMAERVEQTPEVEKLIRLGAQKYPDSRNLAQHHAEILAKCEKHPEALEACEVFLVRFGLDKKVMSIALEARQRIGRHDRLAETGNHSISLCMIVKNEEKNLPECLSSLKPVVDEIIVVDTGSTDQTVDIAVAFGAQLVHFTWNDNFSDARNYSLSAAKGRWIFVIDADEVISSKDYDAVRLAVEEHTTPVAWDVMTRNYTNRHAHGWNANNGHYLADERGGGWHPSRKVRLFPNCEKIKFTGKVHELVEPSVEEAGYEIKVANFVIHHYGGLIEKEDRTISKQLAYFQLGKTKLAENPRDLSAIGELAVQAGQLKLFKEAIELWDRFLELRPGANIALFNKGFSLMGLSRFHEAREMASAVLDTEPFHKEAAFNYGTCVLYTGDVNKAIKILEKILIQHAKHPPLLSLQAVLYLAADKLEPARLTVEKLKLLNYDISEYIYDRATVLDSLGRTGLAQKLRNGAASLEMQVKHHHEVTRS